MERMLLRPAEGRRVRIPESGDVMPAEGMEVTMDIYWRRRLADGDVVPEARSSHDEPVPARKPSKGD